MRFRPNPKSKIQNPKSNYGTSLLFNTLRSSQTQGQYASFWTFGWNGRWKTTGKRYRNSGRFVCGRSFVRCRAKSGCGRLRRVFSGNGSGRFNQQNRSGERSWKWRARSRSGKARNSGWRRWCDMVFSWVGFELKSPKLSGAKENSCSFFQLLRILFRLILSAGISASRISARQTGQILQFKLKTFADC